MSWGSRDQTIIDICYTFTEAAKDHAPCIIFIDEIDSVGVKRTDNNSFAYQTLHQLLNELDG